MGQRDTNFFEVTMMAFVVEKVLDPRNHFPLRMLPICLIPKFFSDIRYERKLAVDRVNYLFMVSSRYS